jgi:hypothetical protein
VPGAVTRIRGVPTQVSADFMESRVGVLVEPAFIYRHTSPLRQRD